MYLLSHLNGKLQKEQFEGRMQTPALTIQNPFLKKRQDWKTLSF